MALRKTTTAIDGTIPVNAFLYPDEDIQATQDGVGIYEGLQKALNHQAGVVYVSSHRLFYFDARNPSNHSFSLDLSAVTQTDYYAGLFASSPKVTLHLSGFVPASAQAAVGDTFSSWECEVCGNHNPSGLSPAAARICTLCGVPCPFISSATSQYLPTLFPSSSASMPPSQSDYLPCLACTFFNHPSLLECELCGTKLPRTTNRAATESTPTSRPASLNFDSEDPAVMPFIKLSFRKGGDKPLYATLKRSLMSKAWEGGTFKGIFVPSRSGLSEQPSIPGISGILQSVQNTAQSRETGMQGALQDLEVLRLKARDMVCLAAELNEKLTATSATTPTPFSHSITQSPYASTAIAPPFAPAEPEEVTFIRSSLSQLGLQISDVPVTLDMIKDERKWIDQLARELAVVLQGSDRQNTRGIMRDRGIIALDEVWGGWNRARGVALIPPQTLLDVVLQLPQHTTPPVQMRMLASGLRVLHTPNYTHAAFAARLSGLLSLDSPKTIAQISREEGLTIGLTWEMVEMVERDGIVCRDDVARVGMQSSDSMARSACASVSLTGEVWWWKNMFNGYVWDGQEI